MAIIQSLHYKSYKFSVPPSTGLDVVIVSVICGRKQTVLCLTSEPHHFRKEDSYLLDILL